MKGQVIAEIRYAQRLAQRTARFYRRVQSIATFASIVGGAGIFAQLSEFFPVWVPVSGAVIFTLFGAVVICMRPADKAVPNEMDMKKYSDLLARSETMEVDAIRAALAEARKTDAPEIESLRDIAFNDVMEEINRPYVKIKTKWHQELLASIS